MEILILGDSWAVELPHMNSQKHLSSLLKDQGHTIHNCGIAGGSNLQSLQKAKNYLLRNQVKIDWSIWFHTEFCRDKEQCNYKKTTIEQFMNYMSHIIYSQYQQFFQELQCKVAVIGACADLYYNFNDYIETNFCVPSWKQEITGVGGFCMSTPVWVPYTQDSSVNKFHWIDAHTKALLAIEKSADFPDNAHPGTVPHQNLAERLFTAFNQI